MADQNDVASAPRPISHRVGVAAFDVDGTLTYRDCVVPFLRTVAGTLGLGVGLAGRAPRLVPALLRRDRDTMKAIASSAVFAGRPASELATHGRRFAGRVFESWIRLHTLALLRGHQARGHDVVLVSASYAAYLGPLGDRLGVTGYSRPSSRSTTRRCVPVSSMEETVVVTRRSVACTPGSSSTTADANVSSSGPTATPLGTSRCCATPTTPAGSARRGDARRG